MPHPLPFRFGVQLGGLPAADWMARVRRIEALGYSTVMFPDHFGPQWDPMTALAAIAAATTRLTVGSLVYDVDYRHPVVYAKAAATLHLLSGGRFEFGLGAGWMQTDYEQAGIAYDRASLRIERLDEALSIVKAMWAQERTSFEGRHYRIREIARAAPLPPGQRPRILIGGGGPKLLAVAGRHADIVGLSAAVPEGKITPNTARDITPARAREKARIVREAAAAAGRDPQDLEFNALVFLVALTDQPGPVREALAKNTGMSPEDVAGCPLFLTGSAREVCERLEKQREELGISYLVIQGEREELVESFAESVVSRLAGR